MMSKDVHLGKVEMNACRSKCFDSKHQNTEEVSSECK